MRRPSRPLVLAVTLPFLAGCTATLAQPVADAGAAPTSSIRGVILRGPGAEQRVEFRQTDTVDWTESSVVISGIERRGSGVPTTRTFPLSDVESVLVRQIDVNRTSLLVGGVMVGVSVLAAILFTGQTTSRTVIPSG